MLLVSVFAKLTYTYTLSLSLWSGAVHRFNPIKCQSTSESKTCISSAYIWLSVSDQVWHQTKTFHLACPVLNRKHSRTKPADKLWLLCVISLQIVKIKCCRGAYKNTWLPFMCASEWGAGTLNSGGSSMNNAMVLPGQTLQSKHYSFP